MNVVQELAIAANIPMPKVYIIDDTAPNAFATGRDPKHASVAITTGLLEKLDREELQGVIGHELSHVQQPRHPVRDDRRRPRRVDRAACRLLPPLHVLGRRGPRLVPRPRQRWRRRHSRRSSSSSRLSSSIVAPIVARFVQLAVNRQREYLADASAVELTRNPYGLERALAKISADPEVLEVANRATQHMYFTNPIKKFEERASGLFSTHPSTLDRINRLRELTGEQPLEAPATAQLAEPRVGDAPWPRSRPPTRSSSTARRLSGTGSTPTTRRLPSCGSARTRRRRASQA